LRSPPPPGPIDIVMNQVPLGPQGGDLKVVKAGSPLNGLTISVPSGAFSGTTIWTVSEMKDVRPTLPSSVRQVGATIQIQNGQRYAQEPFFLAIPIQVRADSAVAAFMRDPATGTFELIPTIARTDTSLVVMTQHLSADMLVIPETGAALHMSGPASAGVPPTGEIQIFLVGTPLDGFDTRIVTSFRPGVDDWEFSNYGTELTPAGYCSGSTFTALVHHYNRKGSKGALYGLYDRLSSIEPDNPDGIRMASVMQRESNWSGTADQVVVLKAQQRLATLGQALGGPGWMQVQLQSLQLAILATSKAQLLGIYRPGWVEGHSIIAFEIEPGFPNGRVHVADPNEPGLGRTIQVFNNALQPFEFSRNSLAPSATYTNLIVMGATSLVPLHRINARFVELEAETAGDAEFPEAWLEARDPVDTAWHKITGTVKTASDHVILRTMCPRCAWARSQAEPERAITRVYDDQGLPVVSDLSAADGANVPLEDGVNDFGVEQQSFGGVDQLNQPEPPKYLDFSWITLDRVPFELTMSPQFPAAGEDVTFTVENGGIGNATSRYRWTVANDPPVITAFGTRTLTVPAPNASSYLVTVELIDPADIKLAKAELRTGDQPFWRITSFIDQDELLDLNIESDLGTLLLRILAAPQSGLIAIDDEGGGKSVLRLRVLQNGLWSLSNCCPPPGPLLPGEVQTTLGTVPEQVHTVGGVFLGWNVDRWAQTSLGLGTGTLTGQYIESLTTYPLEGGGTVIGPTGVLRITGNRTGTTMTGVISITGWFTTTNANNESYLDPDPATFSFPFTAVRLR